MSLEVLPLKTPKNFSFEWNISNGFEEFNGCQYEDISSMVKPSLFLLF